MSKIRSFNLVPLNPVAKICFTFVFKIVQINYWQTHSNSVCLGMPFQDSIVLDSKAHPIGLSDTLLYYYQYCPSKTTIIYRLDFTKYPAHLQTRKNYLRKKTFAQKLFWEKRHLRKKSFEQKSLENQLIWTHFFDYFRL
jgi:hypothetical protein